MALVDIKVVKEATFPDEKAVGSLQFPENSALTSTAPHCKFLCVYCLTIVFPLKYKIYFS